MFYVGRLILSPGANKDVIFLLDSDQDFTM